MLSSFLPFRKKVKEVFILKLWNDNYSNLLQSNQLNINAWCDCSRCWSIPDNKSHERLSPRRCWECWSTYYSIRAQVYANAVTVGRIPETMCIITYPAMDLIDSFWLWLLKMRAIIIYLPSFRRSKKFLGVISDRQLLLRNHVEAKMKWASLPLCYYAYGSMT